jgi:PAS domain S-box-containing protein
VDVTKPLVLLALGDHPIEEHLWQTLQQREGESVVRRCATAAELTSQPFDSPVTVAIFSNQIDDSGGVDLVRALASHEETILRSIVVFDRHDDPRRSKIASTGANEFVFMDESSIAPLMNLIDRIITKEILAAQINASNQRFRVLVENSTDGIYILKRTNTGAENFAYVNQSFQSMVGFSEEEILSDNFAINEQIIAPESHALLKDRRQKIANGEEVDSKYEFVAQRKSKEKFDAKVSVSYIEFEGQPASLGIMEDITERKRFEKQLLRKNRELALLNELAVSINTADRLEDILQIGCQRMHSLLRVRATGVSLVDSQNRILRLVSSEGLEDAAMSALAEIDLDGNSLMAQAIQFGKVTIIEDLKQDPRVSIDLVRDLTYECGMVVPMKAQNRIAGAAFILDSEKRAMTEDDRDLMQSICTLLGTAIEKARLLEKEQLAVKRLKAMDDVAITVSSALDVEEIAENVAERIQTFFGAQHVVIARYESNTDMFYPLGVRKASLNILDHSAIPADKTLMGEALRLRGPVHGYLQSKKVQSEFVYAKELVGLGLQTIVAIPVSLDGAIVGGILMAFQRKLQLDAEDLGALTALSSHVAIAMKNAALFGARERALEELTEAQNQLVESEKLRALGELAAGVAHDFNNVLGAILGRAQILKRKLVDEDMLRQVAVIEKAALDGSDTVRRVQELGRSETIDDFIPVNLQEIIEDVIEMTQTRWEHQAQHEGRLIDVRADKYPQPLWVSGNPHELREVLINLVNNATDAITTRGEIIVGCALRKTSVPPACNIFVRDSGPGIPEAVKARIFDPFFSTKGDRGTGLGLSVSSSIILRHSGTIQVESQTEGAETGTSFEILLPRIVVVTPEQESGPFAIAPVRSEANDSAYRVLVIDDEENIRDILTDILDTGGYDVVAANDGATGLAYFEDTPFDLVLTDLGLPGISGYEVAETIKAQSPRTPVGLVTGWGPNLDRKKIGPKGVDLVLSKPFKFDQVLQMVAQALGRTR